MSKHPEPHPLAGQTVRIKPDVKEIGGAELVIDDWWDRVYGASWTTANGSAACSVYAFRAGMTGLPTDDEVVYGLVAGGVRHLVHVTELEASA